MEIDSESENRAELSRRAQATSDKKTRSLMDARMEKSDEKLDSMTVLMLHYCAGLQHCLDQEEIERVKQEEERSRNDRDATSDSTPEHVTADLDDIVTVDDNSTSVEVTMDDELNASAAMLLVRESENAEAEIELPAAAFFEMEVSSEIEEEKVEDVTVVFDNDIAFAASQRTVSPETGDEERTETAARGEATLAETDTTDVPASSAEWNADVEEVSEVSTAGADLTVEVCGSEIAGVECDAL